MELTILPEIEKNLLPLQEEELNLLEKSLLEEGIRDALVVWKKNGKLILIDGHHRYKIAQKYNLPFEITEKQFNSLEEVLEWIDNNQLGRRNLTDEQRAYLLGRIYERRKRQGFKGNQYVLEDNLSSSTGHNAIAKEIAKEAGVNEKTVRRAGEFAEAIDKVKELSPKVAGKILKGEISDSLTQLPRVMKQPDVLPQVVEKINNGEISKISEAIRKINQEKQESKPLPSGRYSVIYADPPWDIGSIVLEKWESPLEDKYPTMTLEELKALPVEDLSGEDCVCFMWATLSTLPQALELLADWGFKYHITLTWDKGGGWSANGFFRKSELVIFGYKGILSNVVKQEGEYIPTVFFEKKTTHSTKPKIMYEYIENRTIGRKIELFARNKREGWDVWGKEVE